jgi:hypothetical protein
MPKVTLISSNGTEDTREGGCFGFCGRSSSNDFDMSRLQSNGGEIETFRYHVGYSLDDDIGDDAFSSSLLDPTDYFKWLASSSPWAKYVQRINWGQAEEKVSEDTTIDIKTDIPGHCVIGTASAFRLAIHLNAYFIPYFNLALQQGSNPAITMLVFYSIYNSTTHDFRIIDNKVEKYLTHGHRTLLTSSAQAGLGDDEVMRLDNIAPFHLYSFIEGTFEMSHSDTQYRTSGFYSENILSSFSSQNRGINLSAFLLSRFNTLLPKPDLLFIQSTSGGMGSSSTPRLTHRSIVPLLSTLGWVNTLSFEYNKFKRFAGLWI